MDMEKHIKFRKGKQHEFIDKAFKNSGLTVKEVSEMLKVHPRTLRDWRREKYTMTLQAAELLQKVYKVNFPEAKTSLIKRGDELRSKAGKIGGFSHFEKYGSPGTFEGRSKGGKKAMQILRTKGIIPYAKDFDFPASYNENLAEFVGIVLGDGGITVGQLHITLNMKKDCDYAVYVSNLCEHLFGETPKNFNRIKDNATVIYYSGVKLIKYLQKIGLKTGNKVKQQVDPDLSPLVLQIG